MNLAHYLKDLVANEYRANSLAKAAGMHAPDLSRIINGKRECGKASIEKIMRGLRPEHRGDALKAWIEDQLPADFARLVFVVVRNDDSLIREEKTSPNTLDGAIGILANAARSNENIYTVIKALAAAQCSQ